MPTTKFNRNYRRKGLNKSRRKGLNKSRRKGLNKSRRKGLKKRHKLKSMKGGGWSCKMVKVTTFKEYGKDNTISRCRYPSVFHQDFCSTCANSRPKCGEKGRMKSEFRGWYEHSDNSEPCENTALGWVKLYEVPKEKYDDRITLDDNNIITHIYITKCKQHYKRYCESNSTDIKYVKGGMTYKRLYCDNDTASISHPHNFEALENLPVDVNDWKLSLIQKINLSLEQNFTTDNIDFFKLVDSDYAQQNLKKIRITTGLYDMLQLKDHKDAKDSLGDVEEVSGGWYVIVSNDRDDTKQGMYNYNSNSNTLTKISNGQYTTTITLTQGPKIQKLKGYLDQCKNSVKNCTNPSYVKVIPYSTTYGNNKTMSGKKRVESMFCEDHTCQFIGIKNVDQRTWVEEPCSAEAQGKLKLCSNHLPEY